MRRTDQALYPRSALTMQTSLQGPGFWWFLISSPSFHTGHACPLIHVLWGLKRYQLGGQVPWVSEILTQHALFLQGVHQSGEQSGFKPKQSGFKPGCHWGIAGWPWPTHVQGTHFSIYKRGRMICAFKSLWKITRCNLALRMVNNSSAKQIQRSDQLYSMMVVKGTPRGGTK